MSGTSPSWNKTTGSPNSPFVRSAGRHQARTPAYLPEDHYKRACCFAVDSDCASRASNAGRSSPSSSLANARYTISFVEVFLLSSMMVCPRKSFGYCA